MGRLFCKAAHKVDYKFIENHTDKFIQDRFGIQQIQQQNPFYKKLEYNLPTTVAMQIRADFGRSQHEKRLTFLQ